MLRKGFTLIELLIVITIIAILAGAAIPYVADYIDESRTARAKQDMSEIRNGLVRWEITRDVWDPAVGTIEPLVGPFLSQLLIDPWGAAYVIQGDASRILSFGPDGVNDNGINDDLTLDFRPPMAVTKVEYTDVDGSGDVNVSDTLVFYCTRPIGDDGALNLAVLGGAGVDTLTAALTNPDATALDGTSKKALAVLDGTTWSGNDIVITYNAAGFLGDNSLAAGLTANQYSKDAELRLKATGW